MILLTQFKEEPFMDYNMFCYQCQETAGGSGCTRVGVCGKRPSVSNLQDLLVYVTKGLSAVTTRLREKECQSPVTSTILLHSICL